MNNVKCRRFSVSPFFFRIWSHPVIIHLLSLLILSGFCTTAFSSNTMETGVFLKKSFSADLPQLKQRRTVRALVVYGPTDFFFNKGRPSGIQADLLREYEKFLNKGIKQEAKKIHVVMLPVPFSQLIPDLLAGKGDIAAHFLTETDKRKQKLSFVSGRKISVTELIVTHKDQTPPDSIDDLAGKSIYVLPHSSYLEHLSELNNGFKSRGLKGIDVQIVDSHLNSEDVLEMLNAGVIGMTLIDDYKAKLWAQVLPDIRVQENLAVSSGNHLGWAVRNSNPKLASDLNRFWKKVQKGSLLGNMLIKRYYRNTRWIKNPGREQAREKFSHLLALFKKYGDKYGFDALALAAQGYQESELNQQRKSHRGALGIMQLLPSTAADKNVGIKDISTEENNIHAGAKYMAFLRDRYFSDPALKPGDRMAFSWAAYNAGPAKIRKIRARAETMGLNPNVWFGNVEIAAGKIVGRETVRYVANIYKYYAAYKLLLQQLPEKSIL